MTRVFTAVAATCTLLALLIGVPWLLMQWGRLGELISVDWSTVLTRPDTSGVTLGLLSLIGWLAWAIFTASTVTEVLAAVTQQRLRIQLPGTNWLRPLVAMLVAAALSPFMTAHAQAASPAPVGETVVAVPAQEPPPSPTTQEDPAPQQYVVEAGDELWFIAESLLGDGQRWRDLVAANPGLDPNSPLIPGTVLVLPLTPADPTVTVEPGDSLWSLAQEHLGDGERWTELHQANRDQITDPNYIEVGWQLRLSSTSEAPLPNPDDPDSGEAPMPSEPPGTTDGPPVPSEPPATSEPATPSASPTPSESPTVVTGSPATATQSPSAAAENPQEPSLSAHPQAPPPAPTSAPAASPASQADISQAAPVLASAEDPAKLLGPIGGLLAAGIVAGVSVRRIGMMHTRPIGRRPQPLTPQLSQLWTALGRVKATGPPSQRQPTDVLLGWREDGTEEWFEVESGRCLWLTGPQAGILAVTASAWTSLLTAEWSGNVDIVAVRPQEDWEQAVDDPRLRAIATTAEGLTELKDLCARRRVGIGTGTLANCRADSDLAAEFTPTVFIFIDPLTTAQARQITDALDFGAVGVSVIAAVPGPPPGRGHHLQLIAPSYGRLDAGPRFLAQAISAPARHALVGIYAASNTTEPAPWWRSQAHVSAPISELSHSHHPEDAMASYAPTLLLLGEVDLVAASGQKPSRAVGRCLECCAWLLAHPSSTPSQMRASLMVAESTRRSNMSRLRAWLGSGPEGEYLPDAYSGKIRLADAVSSDWERFQVLLAGGVEQASSSALREALSLVRGKPLGSFGFQWGWAEQLRTDMVSMIIDAAARLADRAANQGDFATAEWALGQGMLAAGAVEPLVARRIMVLARRGRHDEVDREVLTLTRQARSSGRDLSMDTVAIVQQALDITRSGPVPVGGARAR